MGGRFLRRLKSDRMSLHEFTSEMNTVGREGMKVPERQRDCQDSEPRRKPGILMQLGIAAASGDEQKCGAQTLIMIHVSDQFGTRKPTMWILKAT